MAPKFPPSRCPCGQCRANKGSWKRTGSGCDVRDTMTSTTIGRLGVRLAIAAILTCRCTKQTGHRCKQVFAVSLLSSFTKSPMFLLLRACRLSQGIASLSTLHLHSHYCRPALNFTIMPASRYPKRKPSANGAPSTNGTLNGTKGFIKPEPDQPPPEKKRKTVLAEPPSEPSLSSDPLREPHPFHQDAEKHGIVLRNYYPHEMSTARARAYNNNELPRPIELLKAAQADTAEHRANTPVAGAVVHWFKMDLRTTDNTALFCASQKAQAAGVPLIALYILSPQDFEAHLTAPVRVDFMLRTLEILKKDLAALDIPLWVETVKKRKEIPSRIVELMSEWGASHLFANMEYEVDELRRDARMARLLAKRGLVMDVLHDTCIVPPGRLTSGSGAQYAVYTPWFRTWVRHVHENLDLLELVESPTKNPESTRQKLAHIFECPIPSAPENKTLSKEDRERFRALWPAGEHEAMKRLSKFADQAIGKYQQNRNIPSNPGTSSLSVHFASGTLSARTAVRTARGRNNTKKLDGGNEGIQTWISEVAWRDFYKHVLVQWPYICMNKPFKPEYANIEWSYNMEHFDAWKEGRTGFPIVDAAMRQLRFMGWVHNRCRMIVASFLCKDLLLDWRMGEKYFMEHLVDGDFASNNGGWGFSASVGVDPQPYFRIFNPLLQSEKFDPDGEYIRKWVPELKEVKGKAIHDPYGRGAAALAIKAGYPKHIVEHKGARERTLAAYKKGIDSGL
ncbi:Deoxyribodipyrimidine photolyase [Podospora pseudoanserina]|uniref:Deoxyribodipyrimidine photolyase n=1 Tax=Podospora pseudoanserina TaxID=2609844 RepID=A0ABR0IKU5_9PEZI|nr:Deoxyribodipyrimidine photolyase [Podospora pseudoanserina]